MATAFALQDEILVRAPIQRCFLLSTCLEIVAQELKMRPVRGRTSGCVVGGDTVLWHGWQLGLPQFHQSRIEPFQPPIYFRDSMIAGRFATFEHHHHFLDQGDGTVLLRDELRFTMPCGWAGAILGRALLVPHIRSLLRRRFARLKRIAEGDEWRRYLPSDSASIRSA